MTPLSIFSFCFEQGSNQLGCPNLLVGEGLERVFVLELMCRHLGERIHKTTVRLVAHLKCQAHGSSTSYLCVRVKLIQRVEV